MICPQCNKEFVPLKKAHNQKYCSRKCYRQSDNYKASTKRYKQSDRGKATNKKYYQSDKRAETVNKYKQTDRAKEIIKKSQKKYVLKNKDKVKISKKKWRESAIGKEYQKNYELSDEQKQKSYEQVKKRYKEDTAFKYRVSMSARLRAFYKSNNIKKTNSTFKIVGCTPEFLKKYLEKQFKPGMTHENHGTHGWHIDHIIPLDKATTPELRAKICHYTNLQPMWAVDNIKKSNK